jgi:hypothetical protein
MSFILPLLFNVRKHWRLILTLGLTLALTVWGGIGHMQARHWHKKHDLRGGCSPH